MFFYQMKVPLNLFKIIFGDLRNIYDLINHEEVDFDFHRDTNRKVCHISVSGENFKYVFHFSSFFNVFLKHIFACAKFYPFQLRK